MEAHIPSPNPLSAPSISLSPSPPSPAPSPSPPSQPESPSLQPAQTDTTPQPILEPKASPSFFASASRFFKPIANKSSPVKPDHPPTTSTQSNEKIEKERRLEKLREEQMKKEEQKKREQREAYEREQREKEDRERREEEERRVQLEQNKHPIIEDEATRAFADDVIHFPSTKAKPVFHNLSPELLASVVNDTLHIDNRRMLPSMSTPTQDTPDVDPWSDPNRLFHHPEPSASSPVTSIQHIEPRKRTAFADLIASWNNNSSNVTKVVEEQFLDHVAEEQKDVAFGGIDYTNKRETPLIEAWTEDDNPWK
ncbi:hypothetical protein BDB01DRAFT_276126 [Pilobolus umbonatus]|nr:hypothetical protein BDB01DRAFT_276126 [Pilobolus umbonatus]